MLTKNEITALNLSPTKKDFVQIWNELLEVAGRLSERWDPTSTNESDPGIVILKALTGIADKLNYNIDKNTLEAFMPTAAQEDSMRKLCDMLGYNVKYYRSAETTVTIKYYNSDPTDEERDALQYGLDIPKFTVITNGDQDINFFIVEGPTYSVPARISSTTPMVTFHCMEGQIVKCESTSDNNVITASQISDSNKFYLPEHQIAENGIFVYNVAIDQAGNIADGDAWEKVDNLNIQAHGTRIFKFGYDSYEGRPYLEFPEDYSELINDGLFIYYTRTSGANGNVSARTLTQLELPSGEGWDKVSAENFSVENTFAATTGANIETISQAYNNFKKTVGTFETLVTCRDYMNKIYNMTSSDTGKYLVSNALVTDIRTDLNRAITICSCDDAGIFYKDTPLTKTITRTLKNKNTGEFVQVEDEETLIDHFDLVLYPFKSYNQIRNNVKDIQSAYETCFKYNPDTGLKELLDESDIKTIAHNIVEPRVHDIVSINNYLKLNAIIGTTSKITTEEGTLLIDKIKIALANAFNMRELDFGDEIPFESILSVIEKADTRISVVSLAEPALYTTFSVYEGMVERTPILREYAVASDWLTTSYADASDRFEYTNETNELETKYEYTFDTAEAKAIYNKLAVRNVLAGRVPLFKYNNTFNTSFSDGAYRITANVSQNNLPSALRNPILDPDTQVESPNPFIPTLENPITVRAINGKIYAGQYQEITASEIPASITLEVPTSENPKVEQEYVDETTDEATTIISNYEGESAEPTYAKITYTETFAPYADNLIVKDEEDEENYTLLKATCKVFPDRVVTDAIENPEGSLTGCISNVTLEEGEFIKFRAPNFITDRTYPAYVNYHLALNTKQTTAAQAAEATSLYSLFTANNDYGEAWRKAITASPCFSSSHKKTFTLVQTIQGASEEVPSPDNELTIQIDEAEPVSLENYEQILNKSGFIRLKDPNPVIALVKPDAEDYLPTIDPISLTRTRDDGTTVPTEYILATTTVEALKQKVDNAISKLGSFPATAWTISYDFEYIPFEITTLAAWETFIKGANNLEVFIEDTIRINLLDFSPAIDYGAVLWRIYQGNYQVGKDILSDGVSKILPFYGSHFGLLDTKRLDSVYIVKNRGRDSIPNFIKNDEEYELRSGEFLYIEYTPSTTAGDDSTQSAEPVQEILGAGTIIKPSGFEGYGLLDSTALESSGKSSYKTAEFTIKNANSTTYKNINLYSLGANEQIAIRELSKVSLTSKSLPNSPTLYIYKNFNNCRELEELDTDVARSYTLKDGEYIFYTDQNQAEFAYFASGTEVKLEGVITLPKCTIIDISTIFDGGISEIPWGSPINFDKNDSITFQEFQYITLGPNDTLQSLYLENRELTHIDANWQSCTDATYTVAGSDELISLSKINLSNVSNWQVCSILELNVSPNGTQTLRSTDKVKTSVDICKIPALTVLANQNEPEVVATLEATDAAHPLSFKTNLPCLSSSGTLEIDDVYTNPNNIKSFAVKTIAVQPPAIIKTKRDRLAPSSDINNTADITYWLGNTQKTFATKSYGELWTRIPLSYLARDYAEAPYDNALKLSISVLPDTYGIFSIYIKYDANKIADAEVDLSSLETWLYLLPGTTLEDIALINATEDENESIVQESAEGGVQLKLKPGLNCIRINKTCDVFIKAYADDAVLDSLTTSTLHLDDLRLVDCQPIEYIQNGEKKLQKTQGLNLDQIGYLNTQELEPLNTFDMQIRKKLREEYTKETLSALVERATTESNNVELNTNALLENKGKLQKLVNIVEQAITEISRLIELYIETDDDADVEKLISLFIRYKELREDLTQEEDLRAELANNKDINEVEQQLAKLFTSLEDAESSKQAMFGELDTLERVALDKLDDFTKERLTTGTILDDFVSATVESADPLLISDLKIFSIKAVNDQYSNRLTELASAASEVSNGDLKAQLLNLLDDLSLAKYYKLLTQIQTLTVTNYEVITTLLADITDIAGSVLNPEDLNYVVDYAELRRGLVTLQEYLIGADISELQLALNTVIDSAMLNSDRYQDLITITDELKELLQNKSNSYAEVITAITNLLNTVQTKINSNLTAYDPAVVEAINNLSTAVNNIYEDSLLEKLTDVQEVLKDLEETYDQYIESLRDSADEAVADILNNLTTYTADRAAQLLTISTLDAAHINEAYVLLPYGVLAILAIWPTYMKRDYLKGVVELYRDIHRIITNPTNAETLVVSSCFYTDSTRTVLRQALADTANITAFQQLFTRAKSQVTVDAQNSRRASLINDLAGLIVSPSELSSALEDIKEDTGTYANRNEVLRQLITKLVATSNILEKQRLLNELNKELEAVIDIDTQLVELTAKLLCPSIMLFDADSYAENFYSELVTAFSSYKQDLLSDTNTSAIIGNVLKTLIENPTGNPNYGLNYAYDRANALLEALNTDNISTFTYLGDDLTGSFLSAETINSLEDICDSISIKSQITQINNSKLLTMLQQNLTVAWEAQYVEATEAGEVIHYNWVDNFGNYYRKYLPNKDTWVEYPVNGTVAEQAAWLTTSGSWFDANKYWRKADGKSVLVNAKRSYSDGKWLDSTDTEITVKSGNDWLTNDDNTFAILDTSLLKLLENNDQANPGLLDRVVVLGRLDYVSDQAKEAYSIALLEDQLLQEIKSLDKNREFYYNVPIEANLAIDFNEGDAKLNTLMNPSINYDINNVNNNFVISKIDINYLNSGLQIARSSKLS